MAGPIPIVENICKKLMITIATATIPKSLGEISLAKIADTMKLTNIPEYFSIADQKTPFNISDFKEAILSTSQNY